MVRLKGFDENIALEKAARIFWKQGYENTSLSELLEEMGILNGSFYHTFRDKKSLYLKVLQRYNENILRRRFEVLDTTPSIKKGIRLFFGQILKDFQRKSIPRGCLMTNSLEDEILKYPELKKYITSTIRTFHDYLVARFDAAKKNGELPKDLKSASTAGLLITYLQGLFRLSNLTPPPFELANQTQLFLKSIGM